MKIREELTGFESRLSTMGTPERAAGEKKYLKSDLEFLGVPVPKIRKEVGAWLKAYPSLTSAQLARLASGLWRRRVHELRMVAVVLLQRRETLLNPADLDFLEGLLRNSGSWAYVDTIAVHTLGPLVQRSPELYRSLDRWAKDEDFWIRRSAMLAFLKFLGEDCAAREKNWKRFSRYADSMLEEKEFFIRKAIGWVLRELSKEDPARVHRFLSERVDRISGLTLREGSKYLPAAEKDALLAAYKAR